MYVNCSLSRMGRVESIQIWRTIDGGWDISFAVDCDMDELMHISRVSQTHMFHQPQTQAIVARVLAALEDLEQDEPGT